jgi:hypothetical protein
MFFIEHIRNFYGRFERPISSLSLVVGFVFDAVTLKRVDTIFENIWILGHLLIIGVFIALIHLRKSEKDDEKNPSKAHFWFVNILQFFFGGILSTFLVFYFRSTDIWVTWPFIALLALAFIANESLKRHYIRLSFQISLLFLSIYSFAIFSVPVILRQIGTGTFLLSGLLSLVFIAVFLLILFYFIKDRFIESKKMIFFLILGIFVLVNLLYFTNLIPPIPLSLKDGGIYHSVLKNGAGKYDVSYEDHGWRDYFNLYPDFHEVPGEPVYAFSAIFSPQNLDLTIIHEWQYFNEAQNKWITEGLVRLSVVGGGTNGFHTYSLRHDLVAGKWRVNIKTLQGLVIGRLRFNIIPTIYEPVLTNTVI